MRQTHGKTPGLISLKQSLSPPGGFSNIGKGEIRRGTPRFLDWNSLRKQFFARLPSKGCKSGQLRVGRWKEFVGGREPVNAKDGSLETKKNVKDEYKGWLLPPENLLSWDSTYIPLEAGEGDASENIKGAFVFTLKNTQGMRGMMITSCYVITTARV